MYVGKQVINHPPQCVVWVACVRVTSWPPSPPPSPPPPPTTTTTITPSSSGSLSLTLSCPVLPRLALSCPVLPRPTLSCPPGAAAYHWIRVLGSGLTHGSAQLRSNSADRLSPQRRVAIVSSAQRHLRSASLRSILYSYPRTRLSHRARTHGPI